DSGLALIHLSDAQKLYRLGNAVTGVRLKVDDLFAAPRVAHELVPLLPVDAEVRDWTLSHANFFRAVAIEKRMMFLILTLIVAVAGAAGRRPAGRGNRVRADAAGDALSELARRADQSRGGAAV